MEVSNLVGCSLIDTPCTDFKKENRQLRAEQHAIKFNWWCFINV
uniref:Uncharacterized protein n=1 Tax=Arundo donax TaxID=35708 RepID=A0A0A9CWV4_ARUDO